MSAKLELYQRENGEWALYPYRIECTHKGIKEQKFTDDIEFYETFEEMHDDFTINRVEDVTHSNEQLERLQEVQGSKYKDYDEIYDYIMNGNLKTNSQIFATKITEQNRADIDYISIMTGVEL